MNKYINIFRSKSKNIVFKKGFSSRWNDIINISEIVSEAIRDQKPLVALESTVLTHGMPWPINFETAKALEEIVISENAVPVTIGILNNQIKAGFNIEEIKELAYSVNHPESPHKVSRRDLYNTRNIKYGGTTVSGTIIIAKKLGIKVFATGGIGGVHKDSINTMDISADLKELGRSSICVVSSGIKSFLDIPKTLEYLETEGVFVCTLGSNDFPGFFVKSCGVKSPNRISSIEEAAYMIDYMEQLNISSGILLGIPIPNSFEEDGILIQNAIEKSILKSQQLNLSGSQVTPFILRKVSELTKGKSLELNLKLIKNNAMIGGKIAFHLNKMKKFSSQKVKNSTKYSESTFAVIGGCIVDNNLKFIDDNIKSFQNLIPQASYNCTSSQTCGGVGRNIADVFSRLGEKCHFISAIGNDLPGDFLKKDSAHINWSKVRLVEDVETSNFSILMLYNNEILFHIGNIDIAKHISKTYIEEHLPLIKNNLQLICMDCNLDLDAMEYIFNFAKSNKILIFIEPTDILLVYKVLEGILAAKTISKPIDIISPNIEEFMFLCNLLKKDCQKYNFQMKGKEPSKEVSAFEFVQFMIKNSNLLDIIPKWIIKLGPAGVVFASKEETFFLKQSKNLIESKDIVSVSGAGDCLAACTLFLHYKLGLSWKISLAGGFKMVKESLKNQKAVPSSIQANDYSKSAIEIWTKEMFEKELLTFIE